MITYRKRVLVVAVLAMGGALLLGIEPRARAAQLGDAARFDTWLGYDVGRSPVAVASADFDGDGKPDVAWARRDFFTGDVAGNSLVVQRNLGDGTMGPIVNYPAVDFTNDVASGDLDGDGDVDLVAVSDGSSLSNTIVDLYLNNGNGSFAHTTTTGGKAGTRVVLARLDGDSDLDIAISNGWGTSYTSVLLNNGNGTFGTEKQIAGVGANQLGITSADFDGDNDRDLAVGRLDTDTNTPEVVLLVNNGSGVFSVGPRLVPPLDGSGAYGTPVVAAGDMDGDSDADIVVGGWQADDYVTLLNQGGLAFTPGPISSTGFGPTNLTLADKDGDGDLDVYAATQGSSFTGDVSFLPNQGNGSFGTPETVESSHQPNDVAVADYDGDGRLDMAVANRGSGTGAVHPGRSGIAFEAPPTYPTFNAPDTVATGDLDGDGDQDVASTIPVDHVVDIKLNDGTGALTTANAISSPPGNPTSVWIARLNADALPDVVWAAATLPNRFGFALNLGGGAFGPAQFVTAASCGLGRVTTADVDNDGDQDVLVGSGEFGGCGVSDTAVSVSINDGVANFATATLVQLNRLPGMVLGADMNGDGLTDLVAASRSGNDPDVAVALGTGGGAFAAPVGVSVGAGHRELALADLDGDGDIDVATQNSDESTSVLVNNGAGVLSVKATYPAEAISNLLNEVAITIGDATADGINDLVVANRSGKDMGVYAGHGDATFDAAQLRYGMHSDLTDIALADMNGDGKLDAIGPTSPTGTTAATAAPSGDGERTLEAARVAAPETLAAVPPPGVSVLISRGGGGGGGSFTLTVTKAGTGSGTVKSTPAGINCGPTCSSSFAAGTVVKLKATPAAGSTFAGWSGACTGTRACTVTMSQARTVTATFTSSGGPFTLTVTKAGTGRGSVKSSPAGIACGTTCSATFPAGTVVTLTATPAAGSTFAGWSGACTGTGTCTVTMNQARTVTATFTRV